MDGRRRATDSDDSTPPFSDTESDGSTGSVDGGDSNVPNPDTVSLDSTGGSSTSTSQQTNGYIQMLRDKCDYRFLVGSLAVAVVLTGGFYMVRQVRLNRK